MDDIRLLKGVELKKEIEKTQEQLERAEFMLNNYKSVVNNSILIKEYKGYSKCEFSNRDLSLEYIEKEKEDIKTFLIIRKESIKNYLEKLKVEYINL